MAEMTDDSTAGTLLASLVSDTTTITPSPMRKQAQDGQATGPDASVKTTVLGSNPRRPGSTVRAQKPISQRMLITLACHIAHQLE